ncbi:MAG TPA: Sua5/YciO/YrdC/YwlC family protein [Kangiella sp.]
MAYINPFKMLYAAQRIQQGGVIAYPTEAVYGLGCHPKAEQAIQRILEIKRRPWQKGLILVASTVEQIKPYLSEEGLTLINCFNEQHKRPVTWLLPVNAEVSPLLRGEHEKIAVRLSTNPYVKALCDAANSALVSTSANRAGQPEMTKAEQVRCQMGSELDLIIVGPTGGHTRPSSIIDAQTREVLRA